MSGTSTWAAVVLEEFVEEEQADVLEDVVELKVELELAEDEIVLDEEV
jgi:hypothetical protein